MRPTKYLLSHCAHASTVFWIRPTSQPRPNSCITYSRSSSYVGGVWRRAVLKQQGGDGLCSAGGCQVQGRHLGGRLHHAAARLIPGVRLRSIGSCGGMIQHRRQ